MSTTEERFTYKAKAIPLILSALLFGVLAFFMGLTAYGNDAGFILNGIFTFSKNGASILYWLVTLSLAVFSILAVMLLLSNLRSNKALVLYEAYMDVPKSGISTKIVRIEFKRILNFSRIEINKHHLLHVVHDEGKLNIAASLLPKKSDLDYIESYISERIA